MRRMRKRIADECDIPEGTATSVDTLPLHLYNTVIQQLKQQKYELLVQSQAEQQRARTSENFSHVRRRQYEIHIFLTPDRGESQKAGGAYLRRVRAASPGTSTRASQVRSERPR